MADDTLPPIQCENSETMELVEKSLVSLWQSINALSRIHPPQDYYRVSIFGSARIKEEHALYQEVKRLAANLSRMGCDVVTGGGPGTMQAANEGENEGDPNNVTRSFGVGIELPHEEGVNPFVEKAYTHHTFFTRLHQFVRLSSAFIVVGGGIGTTLELMMVWQLLQVNHIADVPLILVGDQWTGLVAWARENLATGHPPFADPEDMDIPICVPSVDDALSIIADYKKAWEER